MPLVEKVEYIHEPTDLQCGQAVLAMLTGESVEEIIKEVGTDRETTFKMMQDFLQNHGINLRKERVAVQTKAELPNVCVLSLETPRCWHWSLYFWGMFYDPEHGILQDFPKSYRKYYWEVY